MVQMYDWREIVQKVLCWVSIRELHIDRQKIYATGFSTAYNEKDLSVLVIILFDYFFHHT